jgi:proline iminopeptidase
LLLVEAREGFARVLGHNLFYREFGRGETVLCLHGGPGATHDYMLPLADLADDGYRVVFYDQLGCGRSDVPKDIRLFTVERYVEEVEAFRREMKLGRVHVVGSSWGGMLGIAYALKYQRRMKSLVTVGGLHSVPMASREMEKMKGSLPPDVRRILDEHESRGEYDDPEYMKAVDVFYRRHLCRLEKFPEELNYTLQHISRPVYGTMNGPNEFTIVGNIRYWDVTDELHRIRVPTLIVHGRYDEISQRFVMEIHRRVKGSRLVVFNCSSHLPFWEEREKFMAVVREFLASV